MSVRIMTSIVLYGQIDSHNSQDWAEWYRFSTELAEQLGFPVNYLAVSGGSFKSGKVLTRKRAEKRLLDELKKEQEILSIGLYSLPDDFQTAVFDYKFNLLRVCDAKEPYILLIVDREVFQSKSLIACIEKLKKFINFNNGQIFEMDNLEVPQLYAEKVNSPSAFKTLNITKELY